jgi:hypothetical protein
MTNINTHGVEDLAGEKLSPAETAFMNLLQSPHTVSFVRAPNEPRPIEGQWTGGENLRELAHVQRKCFYLYAVDKPGTATLIDAKKTAERKWPNDDLRDGTGFVLISNQQGIGSEIDGLQFRFSPIGPDGERVEGEKCTRVAVALDNTKVGPDRKATLSRLAENIAAGDPARLILPGTLNIRHPLTLHS